MLRRMIPQAWANVTDGRPTRPCRGAVAVPRQVVADCMLRLRLCARRPFACYVGARCSNMWLGVIAVALARHAIGLAVGVFGTEATTTLLLCLALF